MKRDGIGRREALKRVGTLAAAPVLAGYHPLVPIQGGGAPWKPTFFGAGEAELVAELAEHIIPETETPGARAAKVHQYIDLVLSAEGPSRQEAFLRGLERFAGANERGQLELLREGGAFFERLKELTIEGYYSSEMAMTEELDYAGRTFLSEFDGCTHEEHLSWTPSSGGK